MSTPDISSAMERGDWSAIVAAKDAEIARLRWLVQCLLDNEPDDMAADGITVLDAWRKDARAGLADTRETG